MHKPPELDPSIIDRAPLTDNQTAAQEVNYTDTLEELVITLQTELDEAQAELERYKGKRTFDQVRAEMLQPYAQSVFRFVMWYCIVVAILIVSAGNKAWTGFELSDTILSIISGSTAVSVIGLIGMVISGLFGASKRSD